MAEKCIYTDEELAEDKPEEPKDLPKFSDLGKGLIELVKEIDRLDEDADDCDANPGNYYLDRGGLTLGQILTELRDKLDALINLAVRISYEKKVPEDSKPYIRRIMRIGGLSGQRCSRTL